MIQSTVRPQSIDDVVDAVRTSPRLIPVGGGTKTGVLHFAAPDALRLDMTGYAGIIEYEPGEYTFTARAGTTVGAIRDALAAHGQYLPFDPPLAAAGATLGGTAATGLSGSARQRFGGVRDFLIGVRVVDGTGRDVRGGGKVVKNAAGFDLPKLMVGSLGQLGVLTELSFKVFPEPPAFMTLRVAMPDFAAARAAMSRLTVMPVDLDALDIFVGDTIELRVRLGGLPSTLAQRMARVTTAVGAGDVLEDEPERAFWRAAREFEWAAERTLVKVPLSATSVGAVEEQLAQLGAHRLYSAGASVAWCALDSALNKGVDRLDGWLQAQGMSGLMVLAAGELPLTRGPLLGAYPARPMYTRIKRTLDPAARLPEFIAEAAVVG